MDLKEAQQMAFWLLDEYGLQHWKFEFDNAKRRFGACHYRTRTITMSRHLVALNDRDRVLNTLTHEVAHALTPGESHGPKWQAKHIELGGDGKRCYSEDTERPEAPWTLVCAACDKRYPRYRKSRYSYMCRKCKATLEWERNSV